MINPLHNQPTPPVTPVNHMPPSYPNPHNGGGGGGMGGDVKPNMADLKPNMMKSEPGAEPRRTTSSSGESKGSGSSRTACTTLKMPAVAPSAVPSVSTTTAVKPLLQVLQDSRAKHTLRESAAAALGILVDEREVDPLFEIDAHTSPYSLTTAARTLVAVY